MMDASKRMIVGLLVIALALTFISTVMNVNKLNQLGATFNLLTGAATSTGTGQTNLTITSTTSLTNQNQNINFGSGRVNQSCNFCGLVGSDGYVNFFSNGSNITSGSTCCVSFTDPSNINAFLLENTGNVNISVGYTCSGNCTHATFLGGTRAPGMGGIEIMIGPNNQAAETGEQGSTDTSPSCQGGGNLYRDTSDGSKGGYNITNASSYGGGSVRGVWSKNGENGYFIAAVLSPYGHWLCGNQTNFPLMADNTKDAFAMTMNLTIPNDAIGTGVQSSLTLTFNGTSAG